MKRIIQSAGEKGSASLEACVSLAAFIVAVAFVYSQIQVVICENIMQNAVNNMAMEVSSYVYILDKIGLVSHEKYEGLEEVNDLKDDVVEVGQQAQIVVDDANQMMSDFESALNVLHGGLNRQNASQALDKSQAALNSGQKLTGDASSMIDSIKNIFQIVKSINWTDVGKDGLGYTLDAAMDTVGNSVLSMYYEWKLPGYVPGKDLDAFCRSFNVEKDTISFSQSRLFPGGMNNTVLVVVSYETRSPFSWFPFDRKIVKKAYTAAWLADPSNGA